MEDSKELDKWIRDIDRDYRAITRIIIEKEEMLKDLAQKREALIELKQSRKLHKTN